MDFKKTYDAIVVGSGAAGGIAAKELTEGGLQVLGAVKKQHPVFK
jgi:choline dehydrogenase-like flavoprotein